MGHADSVQNLADVLAVVEGMKRDPDGDEGRRYHSTLIAAAWQVINENRERVKISRLATRVGVRTPKQWLLIAQEKDMGGSAYLRERICREYNLHAKREDGKLSW